MVTLGECSERGQRPEFTSLLADWVVTEDRAVTGAGWHIRTETRELRVTLEKHLRGNINPIDLSRGGTLKLYSCLYQNIRIIMNQQKSQDQPKNSDRLNNKFITKTIVLINIDSGWIFLARAWCFWPTAATSPIITRSSGRGWGRGRWAWSGAPCRSWCSPRRSSSQHGSRIIATTTTTLNLNNVRFLGSLCT